MAILLYMPLLFKPKGDLNKEGVLPRMACGWYDKYRAHSCMEDSALCSWILSCMCHCHGDMCHKAVSQWQNLIHPFICVIVTCHKAVSWWQTVFHPGISIPCHMCHKAVLQWQKPPSSCHLYIIETCVTVCVMMTNFFVMSSI